MGLHCHDLGLQCFNVSAEKMDAYSFTDLREFTGAEVRKCL